MVVTMGDLDRHVVKGRGERRGMYLRVTYNSRQWYEWVPDQRSAHRFDEYKAAREAASAGGFAVRLICPKTINVDDLRDFINEHARGATDPIPCHWVHGANEIDGAGCSESDDFCRECCQAKVDEIYREHPEEAESAGVCVDGGWDQEHDNPPRCTACDARLRGRLTNYGSVQELNELTTDCAPGAFHVESWSELELAVENLASDHPWWRYVAWVVENAKVEELATMRSGLLGVMDGRASDRSTR